VGDWCYFSATYWLRIGGHFSVNGLHIGAGVAVAV
jgi:hypothetical protein